MIPRAPKIPLFDSGKSEPKWITREQAHTLLGRFPLHTRDMAIFALATRLRKSNVAGLEWERVDVERRCCYVPGYQRKSGEPIPVPLNDDAIEVLLRWKVIHEAKGDEWNARVHRYVFVYRRRAPVQGDKLAGAGTHSYSPGDATRGFEEAARFKATQGADETTRRSGKHPA